MISFSSAKKAVVGSVAAILILTVLEFPAPMGFETRPQAEVSPLWLEFFIAILIVEILVIPMIYVRPKLGANLGILGAILNILLVLADQAHLMQPEIAPFGYSMLELAVVVASSSVVYFSLIVLISEQRLHLKSMTERAIAREGWR
jgi:hypothetical protein